MKETVSFHNYKYIDFCLIFKQILGKCFIYLAIREDFVILLIFDNFLCATMPLL